MEIPPAWHEDVGTVFQRVLDRILQGLQPQCVAVYINNINICSPKIEQHQYDLEEVFRQLEAALLQVSVSKMRLAQDSVLVLGRRMSAHGIKRQPHESINHTVVTLSWLKKLQGEFIDSFHEEI